MTARHTAAKLPHPNPDVRASLRAALQKADISGPAPISCADALTVLAELRRLDERLLFMAERAAQLRRLPGGAGWVCRFDDPATERPMFATGGTPQCALDAAVRHCQRAIASEINRPYNRAMAECLPDEVDHAR